MNVPEYLPPPRTEAWLTLPPGVVPKRDLIESGELDEDYGWERNWLGPTPDENKGVMRRFIAEFGEDAAYAWDFPVPSLAMRVLREVFTGPSVRERFFGSKPMLFGKQAVIPLHNAGGAA